jgi:hypothetical protein
MATTTTQPVSRQRKPRTKPQRFIRLCVKPCDGAPGVVRISVGSKSNDYFLTPVAADFGKGFLLEKIGAEESYHVNLNDERSSCECKGFLAHGHCKHRDGLAALAAAGRL